MRLKFIILLLVAVVAAKAQTPGGMSAPVYWNQPGTEAKTGELTINHHAVAKFSATANEPVFTAGKDQLSGITFFCVSQTDSVTERALWSIQTDKAANILMTNRRMANLEQLKYINFNAPHKVAPQIITFSQKGAAGDTTGSLYVYVGTKTGKNIPVRNFEGVLPETIVYDKVLSYSERLRVESYLAIKYGISLQQTFPTSYLNSRGEVIWDASTLSAYSNAIAGVGRDEASGLHQPKSGSMETPGLLEVECPNMQDKDFLIWGDNKGALTFTRKRGEGKKLQRRWAVSATGDFAQKQSTLWFATSQLQEMVPLEANEIFWLAVDQSGTGTFPAGKTSFYPNNASSGNLAQFEAIRWDSNGAGRAVFTLVAAPELFAAFNFTLPTCSNAQQGTITADIAGGTAPYQLKLFKNGSLLTSHTTAQNTFTFTQLSQGTYKVILTDVTNKAYAEEFLLSNGDMNAIPCFGPQNLIAGKSLRIDATDWIPTANAYRYQWATPDGETIQHQELIATKPGVYLLSVTNKEGCTTQRELEIREVPGGIFSRAEVYPNPTSDGKVYLRMQLIREAEVRVTIANAAGKVLSSEMLIGQSFYAFTCTLPQLGIWFITLESDEERKSFKVVNKKP